MRLSKSGSRGIEESWKKPITPPLFIGLREQFVIF